VFERSANFLQDEAAAVVSGPFAAAEQRIKANLQYLHQAMKDAAQADVDELVAARATLLAAIGGVSAIAVVIVIGFGAYLTYRLSSRVRRITAVMNAVSKGGGEDVQIPFTEDRSELGEMARALEVFRRYGAEIASLREFLNTVIDNADLDHRQRRDEPPYHSDQPRRRGALGPATHASAWKDHARPLSQGTCGHRQGQG
jgi:methyl-accepting chemotaxis protein